jgi:hypothetical protein
MVGSTTRHTKPTASAESQPTMSKLHMTVTVSLVSTSFLLAIAGTAAAQPSDTSATAAAPPAIGNALELTLATSFSQGTGELGGNLPAVKDVAASGVGLEGSIGWRINPNLMIGAYGSVAGFGDRDNSDNGVVTLAAGLKADWHFQPAAAWDPWVSLGTGVKFMGIEDGEDDRALTGFEIAKVQLGVDYRLSPTFAIGPVIGASAAMFNSQYDDVESEVAMEIDDKQLNWTFSAGVMGRFDAFGTTR